jgi:hypothetical protein
MPIIGVVIIGVVMIVFAAICIGAYEAWSDTCHKWCPYCGEPTKGVDHWCSGRIEALWRSQKQLYSGIDKRRGKTRERRGRRVYIIQQCKCGAVGRVDVLIDMANRGEAGEVFLDWRCPACAELINTNQSSAT